MEQKNVSYLQGPDHGEGLCNQNNMTVSTIASELRSRSR